MKAVNFARGGRSERARESFSMKQVTGAFTSLPRVLKLVWDTSALLTIMLGILSVLQGFTPAFSVWITNLVINGGVEGIRIHSADPVLVPCCNWA